MTNTQPSTETDPYDGQVCSCGRLAVTAFLTAEFGSVGNCGVPGRRPLKPHGCDTILTQHNADYCVQLAARRG